jgi:hypothetical protein
MSPDANVCRLQRPFSGLFTATGTWLQHLIAARALRQIDRCDDRLNVRSGLNPRMFFLNRNG